MVPNLLRTIAHAMDRCNTIDSSAARPTHGLAPGSLAPSNVVSYLMDRRLIEADAIVSEIKELGGGVSNIVIAVSTSVGSFVVKQALARLRVDDVWEVDPRRAQTEARALKLWGRLLPGTAPDLLDVDPESCALTVRLAPRGWTSWRDRLARGETSSLVGFRLGELLARWHGAALDRPELLAEFLDTNAFDQTRLNPYHRTVISRLPDAASLVRPYLEQLLSVHRTLIHGDFSPKNVLVRGTRVWLIDFEVANAGDPAFDVAFMVHHILIEATRQPRAAAGLLRTADTFWKTYLNCIHDSVAPGWDEIAGQTACLLLARTDGMSKVAGLTSDVQEVVRRVAYRTFDEAPRDMAAMWKWLE
jgi:hypothetical protein